MAPERKRTARDYEQAARLYERACYVRGGHAGACYAWGVMHRDGVLARSDPESAQRLIRRACFLGHAEACPREDGS